MGLKLCWSNLSHTNEDSYYISICVVQTPPILARTHNVSQHVVFELVPCQRRHTIYLKMCWPNPYQNESQHELTKPIPWQRGHKMYFNMCGPNLSHACEKPKCIATCVDQNTPMPARTQNVSLHVLTKPYPCQRGYKMHLNMCWLNQWAHKMYLNLCWSN